MGTYLCSTLRDALNHGLLEGEVRCDCFIAKAGSMPRGGRELYGDDEQLTLEVLKAELPEKEHICVAQLPGAVLRVGLREMWQGGPSTGRFQYDDGIEVDTDGYVTSVQGELLDPERMYKVGSCKRT